MSELAKAMLKDRDRGTTMKVKFNPKEFSVEKSCSWTPQEGAVSDEPPEVFGKPTPSSLSVTLQFDTYEDKGPVTEYTDMLESLTQIIDKDSKKRPPLCDFAWGKFVFTGVVESLSLKYTMFLKDGTPVRCEASLKMKKASSADGKAKDGGGSAAPAAT